jgi:hypothetical protein
MSFSKMGKVLPMATGIPAGALRQQYPLIVAGALNDELGDTHRAIKTVIRWTGASERTAKNWLAGTSGPSGEHLIALARNSDEVFEAILLLIGRNSVGPVEAKTVSELLTALHKAAALAEILAAGQGLAIG